jgi:poly(hydroxyalkanoate) depolymerase family esterase
MRQVLFVILFFTQISALAFDWSWGLNSAVTPASGEKDRFEDIGNWIHESVSDSTDFMNYYVFVPDHLPSGPVPVIVALHGCFQAPESFARDSGLNAMAAAKGFLVVYPEQSVMSNPMMCWNWYRKDNQTRGSGQLGLIVASLNQMSRYAHVDSSKIYAVGLSAGAALVSDLVGCYSDVFAGAVIHSGLEFRAAQDELTAPSVLMVPPTEELGKKAKDAIACTGAGARPVSVLVVQGTADPLVDYKSATRVTHFFVEMNHLLTSPAAGFDSRRSLFSRSRLAKTPAGISYRVESVEVPKDVFVVQVLVEGMGHAWSGGVRAGMFSEPRGPNVLDMMWNLFSREHR